MKKYAKKLKDEEIEHPAMTPDEQKGLWKQWIDETAKGFKEVLKKEGRME